MFLHRGLSPHQFAPMSGAHKITGANASGSRQLQTRTRWAARVAQLGRWTTMARVALLLPILLVLSTGCYTYYQAPGAVGRVVDAETGMPIRGAHVEPASNTRDPAISDNKGQFNLPPLSRTQIMFMYLHNPESISDSFAISASGYATSELHGTATSLTVWRAPLGDVQLKKLLKKCPTSLMHWRAGFRLCSMSRVAGRRQC